MSESDSVSATYVGAFGSGDEDGEGGEGANISGEGGGDFCGLSRMDL